MALPWGLKDVHAAEVWELGYRGAGIVVASQDTGVKWDHPALIHTYRGQPAVKLYLPIIANAGPQASPASAPHADVETQASIHTYNWYDFYADNRPVTCDPDPQVPCDDEGHGTHTVGTMVGDATSIGDTILGLAPAASWIGCRNMAYGVGEPASYAACFEFFLAPYPQGGDPLTDGRPELAPHIINNSWGCPTGEGCVDPDVLRQSVETVRAAGIFVAASAGNGGTNGCYTTNDPISIYDASFTIGAYDEAGGVAWFSSRGPVNVDGSGRLKPDLSAPGVNVRSADLTPSGISWKQGTSMAAPHVAGAVALLWSAVPTLTNEVDLTEQILLKSARQVPDSGCTSGGVAVSPNPVYGYGRLDVLAAVELAQQPVTLTVTVALTDGTPAAAARVTLTDRLTRFQYSTTADAAGQAHWSPERSSSLLYAGSYDLTVAVGATCSVTVTAPVDLQRGETKDLAVPTACAAGGL
jgi:subtilisin family serine protease